MTYDEAIELAVKLSTGARLAEMALAGRLSVPLYDARRPGPERDSMAAMLADLKSDHLAVQKVTRAGREVFAGIPF